MCVCVCVCVSQGPDGRETRGEEGEEWREDGIQSDHLCVEQILVRETWSQKEASGFLIHTYLYSLVHHPERGGGYFSTVIIIDNRLQEKFLSAVITYWLCAFLSAMAATIFSVCSQRR